MKNLRRLLCCLALLGAAPAWSAVSCTISASPTQMKGIYTITAALQATGSFTVTCTRNPATDARRLDIWIGLAQAGTGNNATQDVGANTLTYTVAHRSYGNGVWTDTGAVIPNSATTGAVTDRLDFGNTGSTVSASYTFYFQVAAGQSKPAGVYAATLPVTLRQDTSAGAVLSITSLDVAVSIPKSCRFSTPPSAITIDYTAFSATPVTGQSIFALTCTEGTLYTIALDAIRSVIPTVELSYGLALSATSGTGIATTQGYTVDVSVDANQAGKCTGSLCTGTDVRTINVTY